MPAATAAGVHVPLPQPSESVSFHHLSDGRFSKKADQHKKTTLRSKVPHLDTSLPSLQLASCNLPRLSQELRLPRKRDVTSTSARMLYPYDSMLSRDSQDSTLDETEAAFVDSTSLL